MAVVTIGSVDIEYSEAGSGDSLVFVHGTLNDLRSWRGQVEDFSSGYRTVAYTRRHFHGSEDKSGPSSHSVSVAAVDLISMIEVLRLAPAHLVGSSYGAFTALMAAVKRPDLVRSLTLGEPPIGYLLASDPSTKQIWKSFQTNQEIPAKQLVAGGKIEEGVRMFIDGVIGDGFFRRLPPLVQQGMLENAPAFAFEESPTEPFTKDESSRITMPVLLLTGELSPRWFHTITDRLEALLPQAERAMVPAASHGMHSQNPAAYNQIVLNFLSRH